MGFGDLGVTLAYFLAVVSVCGCVFYSLRRWNDEEEMPVRQHPLDEDLEFEDEI
jgi:hypothetical protein